MKGREIPITLHWYEAVMAAGVGIRRQTEALRKKNRDKYGFSGDGFAIHIHGAGGELAFAKAAGLYWAGHVNVFKEPDVDRFHVRTRSGVGERGKVREDLIVRASDPDDAPFVLVVGQIPNFVVVGWIKGKDAKREEWTQHYGNRSPAYFVPRSAMKPFPAR